MDIIRESGFLRVGLVRFSNLYPLSNVVTIKFHVQEPAIINKI